MKNKKEDQIPRFAAIDIGSNAVRLLFCNVIQKPGKETPEFKKVAMLRVPIRLGSESFIEHKIGEKSIARLEKAMQGFQKLIEVFDVISYRACATSAMREATNREQVIARVFKSSGIKIEVVDGKAEAEIIYSNRIAENLSPDKSYLYIDVGGGSTEITLFHKNKIVASRSFNIGTLRVLHKLATKQEWNELRSWVKEVTYSCSGIIGIGSGGNINKLLSLAKKKDQRQIGLRKLRDIYSVLKSYSCEERISILGLNPDRADVIVPAAEIFLEIMEVANIERITVPQVGFSDGIIHGLYEEYKQGLLSIA